MQVHHNYLKDEKNVVTRYNSIIDTLVSMILLISNYMLITDCLANKGVSKEVPQCMLYK